MYVDGFNFYYAIKTEFKQKRLRDRLDSRIGLGWCDFRRLAYAAGFVTRPDEITTIKYFTSRVTQEDPYHDRPHERERQQGWLAAIQSIPDLACVLGRH